ncbi:MAG: class I SAM-dependent methyltransferase [Myxococcota bacterium]
MSDERLLHSAEYFGDTRDFWWNRDFLELMARRWGLTDEAPRVLDVGCGVGHWARLLLSLLPPRATLVGVDREPRWVERARETAERLGLGARTTWQRGDATRLEFPDASFDVVTCQTVLIHLARPEEALAGMVRVLRPGGLLVVAEPQNLAATLLLGKTRFHAPIDEVLALARLQFICERGKEALGEGNNSVGELVPGMFRRLGLEDVQVFMSDQASPFLPPYETPAARAMKAELLDQASRDFWNWSREDTTRFFFAGGGDAAEFERLWSLARASLRQLAAAVEAGTEERVGNGPHFLISGRRPASGS